jgi:hypothetical protein
MTDTKALIKPPMNSRVTEWKAIIEGSGMFFSKGAMNFFGSKILWDSLTYTETSGVFLFLTKEDNFDRTAKNFSVRMFIPEKGITTLTYTEMDQKKAYILLGKGSGMTQEQLEIVAELAWEIEVKK